MRIPFPFDKKLSKFKKKSTRRTRNSKYKIHAKITLELPYARPSKSHLEITVFETKRKRETTSPVRIRNLIVQLKFRRCKRKLADVLTRVISPPPRAHRYRHTRPKPLVAISSNFLISGELPGKIRHLREISFICMCTRVYTHTRARA